MGKKLLALLVIAGGIAFALYLKDPGIYDGARQAFGRFVKSFDSKPSPEASPDGSRPGQASGSGQGYGISQNIQSGTSGNEPPALKTPANGATRIYSNQLLGRDDPGFTFDNSNAPDHCFVKFEDVWTGKTAAEFFIRAGMTLETKMIGGNFRVKIAMGYKWYGREKLFGVNTRAEQFSKNVKLTAIPVGGENMLSGRGTRFNAELSSPDSFWISRAKGIRAAIAGGFTDSVRISLDQW